MNKKDIDAVKQLLSSPQNIVVIPHRNPDGDAMGASLAMYHYLEAIGHRVTVVAPNDYPDFLKWLPGSKCVRKFDMQNWQSKEAIDLANLIFLMDFNALHRVGSDMEQTLSQYIGTYVMIDHHQQPEDVATYLFSDPAIPATCQMVYQLLDAMDELDRIGPEIATCLYTGIMTDTGSFRFPSTTSGTHAIIADLIDRGADNAAIHQQVYDTQTYERLQLLGCALKNMVLVDTLKTAYVTLTQQELDEYNYQKGDTEGIVNYALSLRGIIFAAIFIEDAEQQLVKISFRSKGSFSVNTFARNHFNGGGHDNAAGGKSILPLDTTVSKFLNLLPSYKDALLHSLKLKRPS